MLHKGDRIELEIERLAFGGQGIAHSDGMVVFVRGAVPGDRVLVTVTRRKPRFADARLIEVLSPSPLRREAVCRHVDDCGGCEWQSLEYQAQLRFKQDQVVESLEHIGGLRQGPDGFSVEPILGMEQPWGYRNKMEYSFGEDHDGRLVLGLHRRGSWREIVELDGCRLAPPAIEAAREAVAEACRELGLRSYRHARPAADEARDEAPATRDVEAPDPADDKAPAPTNLEAAEAAPAGGQGDERRLLRHLVARHAVASDDLLLNLVVSRRFSEEAELARRVVAQTGATSFGVTVNSTPADTAAGDGPFMLAGPPWFNETLAGVPLRVPATAFLQTNSRMCSRLYETALRLAEPDPRREAYDLYCGIGSLSLTLATHAAHVTGIELQDESIEAAAENARLTGTANTTFVAGDVRRVLKELLPLTPERTPAVVLADPPRAGMSRKAVERMAALGADRIVYVSCNPSTLAGNAVWLAELGYRLTRVAPVDMFPQTHHIEAVARFERDPHLGQGETPTA